MSKDVAPGSATLLINGKLCAAALLGFAALALWPGKPEWWQFGLISLMFACVAIGHLLGAVRLMIKAYTREKQIAAFLQQGRTSSSSELASPEALRHAGMIDE